MRIEVERNLVTIDYKNYRHHFYRVTPESEQLLCHAVTSPMGKTQVDTEINMGDPDKVYGVLTSPTLMPGALPKALFPKALMVQLLNAIKS